MKKKVLSLAALALFMVSNLDAKEEIMVSNFEFEEANHECDVYAQDVFDEFVTQGPRAAACEISEIAFERCTNGNC